MTSVLNCEWFKDHEYNPFGRPLKLKKGQTREISGNIYHLTDSKLFRIPAGYPNEVNSIGIVNCPEEINLNLTEIDKAVSFLNENDCRAVYEYGVLLVRSEKLAQQDIVSLVGEKLDII